MSKIPNYLRYEYKIVIDGECPLFDAEPFASELRHVDTMMMSSKPIATYDECVNTATHAMAVLASFMDQVTDEKHVVFSKPNPHTEDEDTVEKWDTNVALRIYVAGQDALKTKDIKVTISADVTVVTANLDYILSLTGSHTH